MAKSLVPKHCVVHSITLDGRGRAEVRYRCGNETGQYSGKKVKARSVELDEGTVSGAARIGFVLSPHNVRCTKRGGTISCRKRR